MCIRDRAEAVVILAPAPMEMLPRVMAFAFVNASVPAWTFVKPVSVSYTHLDVYKRQACNSVYNALPAVVEKYMAKINAKLGTNYDLFNLSLIHI